MIRLALILVSGCIVATSPPTDEPHGHPDENAVFTVDFEARGTGDAKLSIAADDLFAATLDGRQLPIVRLRNRYGIENYDRPAVYEVGPRLTPGPHHLEIAVTNVSGLGVPYKNNPGGLSFALDERNGAEVERIASSSAGVMVDGHPAFEVPLNPLWTRETAAPYVWAHPPN
jgi:hypothetical protein